MMRCPSSASSCCCPRALDVLATDQCRTPCPLCCSSLRYRSYLALATPTPCAITCIRRHASPIGRTTPVLCSLACSPSTPRVACCHVPPSTLALLAASCRRLVCTCTRARSLTRIVRRTSTSVSLYKLTLHVSYKLVNHGVSYGPPYKAYVRTYKLTIRVLRTYVRTYAQKIKDKSL